MQGGGIESPSIIVGFEAGKLTTKLNSDVQHQNVYDFFISSKKIKKKRNHYNNHKTD